MRVASLEQETVIVFNEAEDMASVYTASKRSRDHMLKAGLEPVKFTDDGWWFEVPKRAVRLKPGRYTIYIGGGGQTVAHEVE